MSPFNTLWILLLLVISGQLHAARIEAVVTTKSGAPVSDTAIVAEPLTATLPLAHANASIEQLDRELIPYLTIVQTGTSVEFPNRDPFKHHLYSFSTAKPFEIKLYAGKPVQPIIFDKAGDVALGCNIHDWMEAYVLVVNTPYFAKTDSNGRAIIANLPAGTYRLSIWHPRQKRSVPIQVTKIGSTMIKLDWVINISPRTIKPKPPLDSDQY